jgi:hypothetical protein
MLMKGPNALKYFIVCIKHFYTPFTQKKKYNLLQLQGSDIGIFKLVIKKFNGLVNCF